MGTELYFPRPLMYYDKPHTVLLNGMEDGAFARVIGVHGNHPLKVEYGPDAFIEMTNSRMEKVPSLIGIS